MNDQQHTDGTLALAADTRLTEIRTRAEAAAPGPWHWAGNTDVHHVYLANWRPGHGRCSVMDFGRWGMQGARPKFVTDGFYVNDVNSLAVYEVAPAATSRQDPRVYRADIIGLRHPDAEFIANSRADVDFLLAEVDRLRAALAESEKRAEAYFDGLERVQARVSGVCDFDAGECAAPADEGWAREMDELNTFASQTYLSLEAVYSGPKAVTM